MNTTPRFQFLGDIVYVHCGSANSHPMQTLSFPIITDSKGTRYMAFNDPLEAQHFLDTWLDAEPTDSSCMEVDGDDLISIEALNTAINARSTQLNQLNL